MLLRVCLKLCSPFNTSGMYFSVLASSENRCAAVNVLNIVQISLGKGTIRLQAIFDVVVNQTTEYVAD